MDTYGLTLREIAISAADGHTIYLINQSDSQLMFDMLEEYLVRTLHRFEYNRSEEDSSFRKVVDEFAINMVTISNAEMYKNKAAVKFEASVPNKALLDDFIGMPKHKKKKPTVVY
jgi:hypothetical protein